MTRATLDTYRPFAVAAIWGLASAHLFVQGWLAAADLVIVVIALLRGRMPRERAIHEIARALAIGVVCSVLISLGSALLVALFGYNPHGIDAIVYWACAASFASTFAGQAPAKVRKAWDVAMNPPVPPQPAPPPPAPPALG